MIHLSGELVDVSYEQIRGKKRTVLKIDITGTSISPIQKLIMLEFKDFNRGPQGSFQIESNTVKEVKNANNKS